MNTSQSPNRREMLQRVSCGFGMLALAGLSNPVQAAASLLPQTPRFLPRIKRVIFIFMQGGPSHVDTYDYKPELEKSNGTKIPFKVARTRKVTPERIQKSLWKFKRHGQCGQWVSELFPHTARHVDELCMIHSMHTEGVAHGPATLFLHTGATNLIRPSVGSWITYGLGTENMNLPGFVVVNPPYSKGGPRNWGNAFLPTQFQGTALGRAGMPASEARFRFIQNDRLSQTAQTEQFRFLQNLNQEQMKQAGESHELEATIASYELAFRMQMNAPEIVDLTRETDTTKKLYGIGEKATDEFGQQCLMARRLAESGVRYVQINYADNAATPRWDQHSRMQEHEKHALATDKPVAGLLQDLNARGLLEDTLVWWGGEFGRTPYAQGKDGRDHNPNGFTVWLAGGGVKKGFAYGATDEYGYNAIEDKVHMHDLHASILHLLGLDHQKLTYRHAGRDFRLTDVFGSVVQGIMS